MMSVVVEVFCCNMIVLGGNIFVLIEIFDVGFGFGLAFFFFLRLVKNLLFFDVVLELCFLYLCCFNVVIMLFVLIKFIILVFSI